MSQIRVVERDLEKVNTNLEFSSYSFADMQAIKANPQETMLCEYLQIPETVFSDLLVWSRKTFQTEIKHTLDITLK